MAGETADLSRNPARACRYNSFTFLLPNFGKPTLEFGQSGGVNEINFRTTSLRVTGLLQSVHQPESHANPSPT